MNSYNAFSRKKTLLTAAAGAVLVAASGFIMYFLLEEKKKANMRRSWSDTHEEFFISSIRTLSGSKETLASTSRTEYDTCNEMYSTVNTEENESSVEYFDMDDETFIESLSDNRNSEDGEELKLFEKVDALMSGDDDDRMEAYKILKENELGQSENPNFLWRFAKSHTILANIHGANNNLEMKKELIYEGLKHASKALAFDRENPDAHKWYAILNGMLGDFVSIKEKIEIGYVFQKHLLNALKHKVNDYSLHHLLARFKYEVAKTSWWERKIASTIFAEIPSFTYKDAIPDLKNAEKLNPVPWKENRLLLAKCYAGEGNYHEAMNWLESAKQVPVKTKQDELFDEEICLLIEKYRKCDK